MLERRCPTKPVQPGLIERVEFEYIRHGTVNFLASLLVHRGTMHGWHLERNDGACLREVLPEVLRPHRKARRVHLIWDGGPSHTDHLTLRLLQRYGNVRVLFTPAHASWLDQAELLLRAFRARYLKGGDWTSRAQFIRHLEASWPEYNQLYAHPFTWLWTRAHMHEWVVRHRA